MRVAESSRVRTLVTILFMAILISIAARSAGAARPVIPPEREAEIEALFAPHRLGDELAPGWTLHSFAIETATIRVWLAGPDEDFAQLTLDHPDYAPPGSRPVRSFALSVVDQPSGSESAVAEIAASLERNDDGQFWAVHGSLAEDGEPNSRFADGPPGWVGDGLLWLAVMAATMAGLLVHALRQAPRWIAGALLAIVVLGVLLRLGLTREATLEPWSYSRFMVVARMIYEGPVLALLHPGPVYMTSVITTSVLICSMLAPISVFLLARYLLADDRAALICAGLIAVLPLHIRFSHGDVASIPSLTISALVFAMIQAAGREPKRAWPIAMLLIFAVPMMPTFLLRPLNILYAPLVFATLFVDQGVWVDKPAVGKLRLAAIALVIGGLTIGFGIPHLMGEYGGQVREGLSVETLRSTLEILFSFEYNSLLNPRFTPPGLTALAVFGAIDLIRRKRWRLALFLTGWLLASLATHAYVVPMSPFMQARYHLHLVVPFVCLAACGIEAVLARLRGHRHERALTLAMFGYLLASPLIHLGFIRDVDFNDQREWVWVHGLRESIPAECTIVEYGGRASGARFARVGAHVVEGMPSKRWKVIEIPEPAEGEPELSDEVRELLVDPPECAYWYEGMPCFGNRPPDTAIAPVCDAIPGFVELEEVERLEFESRPYDENLARGLGDEQPIVLRLSRMHRRAPSD
ncbi:hypothetical protein ACNOYE_01295 [Nannocystaceae bacterium ST9]